MAVTVPRQARSRNTFDAIVDAAAQVLLAAGIEGLNTNEVARAAQVNIATLYRYFDDKYDLVEALLTRANQLQLALVGQEMKRFGAPAERVGRMFDQQLQLLDDNPWVLAVHHALRASPRLHALRQSNRRVVHAMVLQLLGGRGAGPGAQLQSGGERESAIELLVETFGMGLALLADTSADQRDGLQQELRRLLDAYLETLKFNRES